ncbi:GlsB/YeaQ/YmgE family stress response membrane protein [Paenibacillus physcomitrellae]|uniref:GlsB/YeaQ/YmgE family stress response membrane protein n=1 Tax=Paenibacillus physcomitrellae TaxID=1619311 RepID=A0ABQ1GV50_9BACL|nr:GlsB/YeaQ/YmgE family stress response membrane protein [Paenibacillus physcomitrellae]GGA50549.1 hypothetical protein GCM10010917_39770 [Paenibacillus physcomitrellae]
MWAIPISILIAVLIGLIGEALTENDILGGATGAIIAGLAGSWLGSWWFDNLGPVVDGFAVIPAIVGAASAVLLLASVSRLFARTL